MFFIRILLFLIFPLYVFAQQKNEEKEDINKTAQQIITVIEAPDFLAADGTNAWVVDDNHNRIHKLSASDKQPLMTVNIQGICAAPVIAFDAVWTLSCSENTLYRLDKTTGKIIAKISTTVADPNGEMAIAAGDGFVWLLSDSAGFLSKINPTTNVVEAKIAVRPHSYAAAFGFHSVWVSNRSDNSVQRVDAKTDKVLATIPVGKHPRFISAGENGVWTLNQWDGTVSRIDPSSNTLAATIDVQAPGGGGDIAAGAGKVWVISTNNQRWLQTIDPSSNTVDKIYLEINDGKPKEKVDGAVRVSQGYVWASDWHSQKVWVIKAQ